jgi:hypothetical protein
VTETKPQITRTQIADAVRAIYERPTPPFPVIYVCEDGALKGIYDPPTATIKPLPESF